MQIPKFLFTILCIIYFWKDFSRNEKNLLFIWNILILNSPNKKIIYHKLKFKSIIDNVSQLC